MKIKQHLVRIFFKKLLLLIVCGAGLWGVAHAAGGGENLLLVVNPNDEPSLRIANAYIDARHIPACNVLYIAPPAAPGGLTPINITEAQFDSTYLTPITSAIASRGLSNQIDYIGTLGQPHTAGLNAGLCCIHSCLAQLTQLQNGMPVAQIVTRRSELCQTNFVNTQLFNYTPGTNTAIHHTQMLPNLSGTSPTPNVQWYISGMIGYTGQYGMSPGQVIQSLRRSVAADGTKPAGTIYFEYSGDIRTTTRSPYWPAVQSYMTNHGIPWIQENAGVPVGHKNVLGAEIGVAGYTAPNNSSYVAGSWADNFSSNSGEYDGNLQTQMDMLLQAGCAGTAGTVVEPKTMPSRTPLCDKFVYQHDGSTLGEAFYKSVYTPDLSMFQGDLLSQAFADIPQVTFTSAPTNSSTVSGIVSLTSSASLSNPLTATGIASMSLFVDGINTGITVSGSSGTFYLNTTTLPDGQHELRVVAYNNSQAGSEGYALLNLAVNNLGQSVSIGGPGSYNIGWNQTVMVPVSAVQGTGASITGIQLQSNGRVLGAISGNSGNVALSGTLLAYDGNPITPVAILSNGTQIQGIPITVTRQIRQFPGKIQTSSLNKNPGFDFYYYPGAAGNTLASTNFSGTAAYVAHANVANVTLGDAVDPNIPSVYGNGNNAGLAIAIKGLFTVTTPGEYGFSGVFTSWTSGGIFIDGVLLESFDLWNGSSYPAMTRPDTGFTVYLLPGEHTVTVELVQATASSSSAFALYYRGLRRNVPISTFPGGTAYNLTGPSTANYAFAPFFYTNQKAIGH